MVETKGSALEEKSRSGRCARVVFFGRDGDSRPRQIQDDEDRQDRQTSSTTVPTFAVRW
jgi:hypothetical protein